MEGKECKTSDILWRELSPVKVHKRSKLRSAKGQQGLFFCDEFLNGDAAYVNIQWYVVDFFAVQGRPVEVAVVGRAMEQADGVGQIIISGQFNQFRFGDDS